MHTISPILLDIIDDFRYINENFHEDGVTPEPSPAIITLITFLGHFVTFCDSLADETALPEYVSYALVGVAESFAAINVGTVSQRTLTMQKRFQLLLVLKGYGADVTPTLPSQFWPESWNGVPPTGVDL